MRFSNRRFVALLSTFVLLVAAGALIDVEMAQAFSSGPLDGKTGAPGEANCTQCHTSFPLDTGFGFWSEATFGDVLEYTPDETYDLVFSIVDELGTRWGFEITFLDAAGEQAGVLSPVDANTQVSTSEIAGNTRQYGKHTTAGTAAGTPVGTSWAMTWIAPAEGAGNVTLYGMANAANNNGGSSGDYIYSMQIELAESGTSASESPVFASLRPNFPNPFNPKTTLNYSLEQEARVRLSIYDSSGRLVRVLDAGSVPAGEHSVEWNGRDAEGAASASGVYFARLQDGSGRDLDAARKMTLVK